jgi:hypothetical protein
MRGQVKHLIPGAQRGIIQAEDGAEYVFERDVLTGLSFDELRPGSIVEFEPSTVSDEGARAMLVGPPSRPAQDRPLTPTEETPAERGGGLANKPPPEVKKDEVNEASWESFPASDPSTGKHIT